jgi:hypothetical protein
VIHLAKVIRDIWILFQGGTVIFQRTYGNQIDAQLFGGFMSALNTFAQQIYDKGLSGFELGNLVFFCKKEKDLLFIINTDKKANKKQVYSELEILINKFVKSYPPEIFNNWKGDVSIFENFKNKIEESLETPVQKLRDAFW